MTLINVGWTSANLVKHTDSNESNMFENYIGGQFSMLATPESPLFLGLLAVIEVISVCS